jgi:BLTP2/FMP27/Hobbit, C-terminal
VTIPRFSVTANSATFAAIYNIISYVVFGPLHCTSVADALSRDLLLYQDPMQKSHCEALDRFIYVYDFRDRHTAADVVANIQRDLRQLRQLAQGYELHFDVLDQAAKLDLLAVKSQMFTLTKELGLIFEAISHVQAKMQSAVGHDSFAIRLDASSSEISWNMLDGTGSLLAKLSLRGLRYTWLSRMDGSMNNRLAIDDMQALNGSPTALFPEMLVKYETFGTVGETTISNVDLCMLTIGFGTELKVYAS